MTMRFTELFYLVPLITGLGCRNTGPKAGADDSNKGTTTISANALVGSWFWEKNTEFFRTEKSVLEFFSNGEFSESVESQTAGATPILYATNSRRHGTWFVHENLLVLRDPESQQRGIGIATIFEIKTITPDAVTISDELIGPNEQVTWRRVTEGSKPRSASVDHQGFVPKSSAIEHATNFSGSLSNAARIFF